MQYEADCPNGHRLRVTEAHFNQQIQCPTCNTSFTVPDLSNQAPDEAPKIDTGAAPRRGGFSMGAFDSKSLAGMVGRPMLAVGLILVLLSRGCDSIGNRGVGRAQAIASKVRTEFKDGCDSDRTKLDNQIKAIQDKDEPTSEDSKNIAKLREDLSNLTGEQQKAQQKLEEGKWRDLDIDARDAAVDNRISGYWREVFFVFSTVILAIGLLAVSWIAEGTERMVCLIMLAILTFSIYIGGIAWISTPGVGPGMLN
ncbi:MAG: hypothetical protein HQ567_27380 [Candidatus Nealsonbacteria bacterium]|nr:hypothetical protein [Candidatus Nealsonbacteria bacterium]